MQAVILAAGMGKRLGELTKDNTKCMLKVNGKTLIERLLGQLDGFGLSRIVIVAGYERDKLRAYVDSLDVSTKIEWVENAVYDKTNNIHSLYLAKEWLLKEDTLLFESDLIFEDRVIKRLVENPYPDLALVAKFESWMDGTSVIIDDEDNITKFIDTKSFKFSEIPSYYKTVNIYKFSREFSQTMYVPFLEAYCAALGKNEYYEQVLKVITLLDKPGIKAERLDDEHWYEIDDIQDLDIAESIFADDEEMLDKMMARYGGYWRYPNILDYCYLVNPYFPNQRLVDEMKANFERLLANYPSGMSVNSLLAGKMFGVKSDNIAVGNGAAELIKSLMGMLDGKIGVIRPTFEEYPNRVDRNRLVEMTVDNSDYRYDENQIIDFFGSNRVENLLIINPDNPSGNYMSHAGVMKLIAWAEENNVRIIVDESFVDFANDDCRATLIGQKLMETHQNLVIVKSISKSYGVPGIRLGVIASGDNILIDRIKKDVAIWNINSFGEFFMQIYGKYQKDYESGCVEFRKERQRFMTALSEVKNLRVINSEANYFMCQLTGKLTSRELTIKLLKQHNILIKDCSKKVAGKNYIRLAVRSQADNQRFVEAIKEIMG